ncbi:MAG: tRNA pseudouridine(13) synthase TruD [Labilithrix sp.]|nr:tRNA pseudouridine(13) synthase TruD [Labilithrix sp.]MCW5812324.1 tRNA pseudouridine(13) synthase TruD [Labilithrix sp.]
MKPRGTIKSTPADFQVDEIPAYEPSGEGSHLYLHLRKTNRTTDQVVADVARALGIERRGVGVAGVKDKVAVTTQWISVPAEGGGDLDERARALAIDGVDVLAVKRHGNKLKTGHLHGNRFAIVVRGVDPARAAEIAASFERIAKEGVPNAFGAQRFGKHGDNVERARAWLTGSARAPADPRLRRFHFSAVQSAAFNAVLEERVKDGSWIVPLHGDLLKKEETGGMFVCTDVQQDRERAAAGEVCPTGPIVGDKMRQPEADAFDLEQRIVAPFIEGIDLRRARSLGEGTRRALRLRVSELLHSSTNDEVAPTPGAVGQSYVSVRFVLPKGAYATTVLSNVFDMIDADREPLSENETEE